MTAEQNIIAAALDLMFAVDDLDNCLSVFGDDYDACRNFANAQDGALSRLGIAIQTAGIDWRDPVVRDRFRKGQGFASPSGTPAASSSPGGRGRTEE